MFQVIVAKMVAKHGLIPLVLLVGDLAVKATKTKKDDEAWAKIRKFIKKI
tara:strand:- start:61 stop:210 length:150 start_codon:yes stop_codon:yes gene_type:complete